MESRFFPSPKVFFAKVFHHSLTCSPLPPTLSQALWLPNDQWTHVWGLSFFSLKVPRASYTPTCSQDFILLLGILVSSEFLFYLATVFIITWCCSLCSGLCGVSAATDFLLLPNDKSMSLFCSVGFTENYQEDKNKIHPPQKRCDKIRTLP